MWLAHSNKLIQISQTTSLNEPSFSISYFTINGKKNPNKFCLNSPWRLYVFVFQCEKAVKTSEGVYLAHFSRKHIWNQSKLRQSKQEWKLKVIVCILRAATSCTEIHLSAWVERFPEMKHGLRSTAATGTEPSCSRKKKKKKLKGKSKDRAIGVTTAKFLIQRLMNSQNSQKPPSWWARKKCNAHMWTKVYSTLWIYICSIISKNSKIPAENWANREKNLFATSVSFLNFYRINFST